MVQAVEYAHSQGIIHRDIKPENVLLAKYGKVFLADFGLARQVESGTLTQTGVIVGTPQYMAPEQAQGQKVDERADLYSLGALLFFMLTGRPPFVKEDILALLLAVATETSPPMSQFRAGLSREVEWIVEKCLEKSPQDRYASAKRLRQDIERLLSREPVSVGPPSLARHLRRYLVRHRKGVVLTLLALLAFALYWGVRTFRWYQWQQRHLRRQLQSLQDKLQSQRNRVKKELYESSKNLEKWYNSSKNFTIFELPLQQRYRLRLVTENGIQQMQRQVSRI